VRFAPRPEGGPILRCRSCPTFPHPPQHFFFRRWSCTSREGLTVMESRCGHRVDLLRRSRSISKAPSLGWAGGRCSVIAVSDLNLGDDGASPLTLRTNALRSWIPARRHVACAVLSALRPCPTGFPLGKPRKRSGLQDLRPNRCMTSASNVVLGPVTRVTTNRRRRGA